MKIELFHTFPCTRDVYEKNINNATVLSLCEGRLPYLKSRVVLEHKPGPGPNQRSWRFRCEADYKLPAAAQKVLGERLGWFEESTLDENEHVLRFKVIPDVLAGRYRCEGEQVYVERDDGQMDRLMTVEIVIAIPIVGGIVERTVADRLKETYAVEFEIQTGYFRGLAAAK